MDTRDLRCFRLVYEQGSINKAANMLFITPQGLSRIIRKLEDEFQTQLFLRSANGTLPTESGNYLYTHSQELLSQIENIKQHMKQLKEGRNLLRIGFACGTLQALHLESFLFNLETPFDFKVQWEEIENQQVFEKLLNHTLDFGFIIGSNSHAQLEAIKVYTGKMNALIFKGHPLYNHKILHIEDLKDQPLISLNEKYSSYHNLIQRCADFDFTPNIRMRTMESQLIYRFCSQKLGIGIDADIHQNTELSQDIHQIEIIDAIPWEISLIYHPDFANKKALSKLKEGILKSKKRV